jgi:LPS sulfotransferase NodH
MTNELSPVRPATRREREVGPFLRDLWLPYPPDQARVVIFAQGRTGSTLLEHLICSTGHFEPNGEILNVDFEEEVAAPAEFVRGMAKSGVMDNFIFHVKIYQLTHDRSAPIDPAAFLKALREDGWTIVHLTRENIVQHTLSNVVAEHRGCYRKFDDEKENLRITVDCEAFVAGVRARLRHADAERAALDGVDHLAVSYERDLLDASCHQRTVERLLDHLGLERRPATTRRRKVNTIPAAELVVNYDEFAACVTRNGWKRFLREG